VSPSGSTTSAHHIAQALVEMFDDPKDLSELIFGIEMDAKAKFGHKLLRIR
jgi:hypothetical protein